MRLRQSRGQEAGWMRGGCYRVRPTAIRSPRPSPDDVFCQMNECEDSAAPVIHGGNASSFIGVRR